MKLVKNLDQDKKQPEEKMSNSSKIFLLFLAIIAVSALQRYVSSEREEADKERARALQPMMEKMNAEREAAAKVREIIEGYNQPSPSVTDFSEILQEKCVHWKVQHKLARAITQKLNGMANAASSNDLVYNTYIESISPLVEPGDPSLPPNALFSCKAKPEVLLWIAPSIKLLEHPKLAKLLKFNPDKHIATLPLIHYTVEKTEDNDFGVSFDFQNKKFLPLLEKVLRSDGPNLPTS